MVAEARNSRDTDVIIGILLSISRYQAPAFQVENRRLAGLEWMASLTSEYNTLSDKKRIDHEEH